MQAVASPPFPEDGRASFCPFHNAWLLGQCCFHKSNGQNWKKWGLCLSLLGEARWTTLCFLAVSAGLKCRGLREPKAFQGTKHVLYSQGKSVGRRRHAYVVRLWTIRAKTGRIAEVLHGH